MNRKILLKFSKFIANYIIVIGFITLFSLAWFSYTNQGSWRIFSLTSGSMRPEIPMGSLVIGKKSDNYEIGDVITFQSDQRMITHRIVKIIDDKQFQTKGDSNKLPDQRLITKDRILGKVVLSIPRLGRILTVLRTKTGIILLIILPGTILIWEELRKIQLLLHKSS